ncbi:hypothetical protein [Vibrio coralliilyticus]|uniref:hypothetical protein n=1 Tax=Vibrio coralliilyticus TaxID=190893 RepID=UPI002FD5FC7C
MNKGVLVAACLAGLTACSSSSQLTVFDGLTYTAKNEGGINDPIRFYPLQTTQISLDGQLTYQIGDLCYSDRHRSPMTSNCFNHSSGSNPVKATVIQHKYNSDSEEPIAISTLAFNLNQALTNATLNLATCNEEECQKALTSSSKSINNAADTLQAELKKTNVRVYNWSDNSKVSANNTSESLKASGKSATQGITIVNGYSINELKISCIDSSTFNSDKSDHLKVVTKTLAADSISFINTQSKISELAATLNTEELAQDLKGFSKELLALELSLKSASTISSMGMLKKTKTTVEPKTEANTSTYLAVLTDLEDLKEHFPECE